MFTYEHHMDRPMDTERVWNCYSDVTLWTKWDPIVKSVEWEGPFEAGRSGVKQLRNGQPLPFTIAELEEGKYMVLTSERGPMKIRQEYHISENQMVWKVFIEGGTDNQRNRMGEKITSHIPETMNRLCLMVHPVMKNREEALQMFFEAWTPVRETEEVPLSEAVGRVLAEDLTSKVTLPLCRVSGMDGIAVKSKAFEQGIPDTADWKPGLDYERADTGDDFSDDFDAVIMIEKVELREDGGVELKPPFPGPIVSGAMTRPAGSIIKEGDPVLRKGSVIRPTDLAALAMGNYAAVPVVKRPTAALIPTGSELVAPGSKVKRGENIDTNSYMVTAQLKAMGADVVLFPIIRDEKEKLEEVLAQALEQADLVVINGGSSKGGEDFNVHLLKEKGTVICHEVAAVPGRPISLALIGGKPVINIPGPTLAAYFATDWCLGAIVSRWLGTAGPGRQKVTGTLMEPLEQGGPVQILHRINVEFDSEGNAKLYPIPMRGSSQAAQMASNAQYVTELFEEAHERGETLTVELI